MYSRCDFIAWVSLAVHNLILHLIARTLPAHSSYMLHWGLGKERGKIFMTCVVLGNI